MGRRKHVYTDMTKRIGKITGMYDYQVKAVVVAFIRLVISDLALGKSVHCMSLGKFFIKTAPKQNVWDPYRKKLKTVGERFIPKFIFGRRALDFIRKEVERSIKGT